MAVACLGRMGMGLGPLGTPGLHPHRSAELLALLPPLFSPEYEKMLTICYVRYIDSWFMVELLARTV